MENSIEKAKELILKEMETNRENCLKEIQEVLSKYDFKFAASTTIHSDGTVRHNLELIPINKE
jgi:hypothetical protein